MEEGKKKKKRHETYGKAGGATSLPLLPAALFGFLGANSAELARGGGHLFFWRDVMKKKKEEEVAAARSGARRKRRRMRGEGRGGNAVCWCGVVRRGLLAHSIQS